MGINIAAGERAKVKERLGLLLKGRVSFSNGPRAEDLTANLDQKEDLLGVVQELTRDLGMGLAIIVATDERQGSDGDFKVRYIFEPASAAALPLADIFVTLTVSLDSLHPSVPSITPLVPAANWHEREMRDMFGIDPEGHPDPRSLVLHDGWPAGLYPLRKDFDPLTRPERLSCEEFPHLVIQGEGVMEVPVGPIHAGIIEPGHFRFSSVGETVLHLDARLFYTHRGLEKRAEGLVPGEALFIAERLCGACSVTNALAFSEATEQIAGVTVPPRARYLRTIALELERLYNHVGDIGAICAGVGFHWGTSSGARLKEVLQRENERISGNRFLRGMVVPGGVHYDLSGQQAEEVANLARITGEGLTELMTSFSRNSSVMDRMDHTGALATLIAKDLGVTGVAARASGIDRDARRDHPHAAYAMSDRIAPRVETKSAGDVNSRVKIRAQEALESIRILQLLVEELPEGSLSTPIVDVLPPGRIGLSAVESPRGATIHWLRTDGNGRVDRYHVRSASYANWPAIPYAAVNAIVPDFPLVNKSFELCYACTDR
ncbi:MAG TPA: NADH-quinone oxidoreductase subunit C [Candidatus Omnitrophota bacterium]|nr:NADH-quinone oxidoreductase subunit C [Candidatus Omnitrophota bacterium]